MPPIRSEKHKKEEDIIWESEPRSEDKRKKKANWPRHDNWPQGLSSKFSAPNQYICFALHSGIVPNKRETEKNISISELATPIDLWKLFLAQLYHVT